MTSFLEFTRSHLWLLAPLLAVACFALAIALERFQALVWDYAFPFTDPFLEKIRYLVLADRLPEAVAFCDQVIHKPFARVVREGLARAHQPECVIEGALHVVAAELTEHIEARVRWLPTLSILALLLGLLSGLVGFSQTLEPWASLSPPERTVVLGAAVSAAAHATALGLVVTTLCFAAYSVLSTRSRQLVTDLKSAQFKTLVLLRERYYATDQGPDALPSETRPSRTRTRGGL